MYAGDPRRFSKPDDRLNILASCITVTGYIDEALPEPDGDFNIRFKVDPDYENLLNSVNNLPTSQHGHGGHVVVEPVCERTRTQQDTSAAQEQFEAARKRLRATLNRVATIDKRDLERLINEVIWLKRRLHRVEEAIAPLVADLRTRLRAR